MMKELLKPQRVQRAAYSNFYLVQFVKANGHAIIKLANVFSSLAISVTNRRGNNSKNTPLSKEGRKTYCRILLYIPRKIKPPNISQNIFTSFSSLNDFFFKSQRARLCSLQHAKIISGLLRKIKHMFPVR